MYKRRYKRRYRIPRRFRNYGVLGSFPKVLRTKFLFRRAAKSEFNYGGGLFDENFKNIDLNLDSKTTIMHKFLASIYKSLIINKIVVHIYQIQRDDFYIWYKNISTKDEIKDYRQYIPERDEYRTVGFFFDSNGDGTKTSMRVEKCTNVRWEKLHKNLEKFFTFYPRCKKRLEYSDNTFDNPINVLVEQMAGHLNKQICVGIPIDKSFVEKTEKFVHQIGINIRMDINLYCTFSSRVNDFAM